MTMYIDNTKDNEPPKEVPPDKEMEPTQEQLDQAKAQVTVPAPAPA
jgi:hypothetical protein